jgi:hypothetical protein
MFLTKKACLQDHPGSFPVKKTGLNEAASGEIGQNMQAQDNLISAPSNSSSIWNRCILETILAITLKSATGHLDLQITST